MKANQSLKIALSGYGRMGHEVEKISREKGHEIVCILNDGEDWTKQAQALKQAQVVIDFSEPSCAAENIG
ncbi:MAG: 4-hydroxy-tetrahydrodipicolinate reductase, partial [Bacteroidales bacterium]|nr:4-hydroxy-tetrahydrodipicolinate reductase [Bacteroidales bacterium]